MKEGQMRLTFQLSKEDGKKIEDEAIRLEVPISEIIRRALKQYFNE